MSPERWKQVEQIYHSALDLEPGARTGFLRQACAGDEDLRKEVETLLSFQDEAEDFIEAPALEQAAKALARERTVLARGRRIGRYQIIELIGAGGMGEVYRAEDTRHGREVAVKLLPPVFAEDADRVRRFKHEVRAAGMLTHPNILALYEAGTHEGSPYLIYELLVGETLRERLGTEGPGTSRRALPLETALDFARQVALGLAAAHEKGIVHRDLKPPNLFITKDERVKILDFGLAKLTQRQPGEPSTEGTRLGAILGTVGYMSPEQVRGQIVDHRADIFAFGAILYEMLSGRPAFDGKSPLDKMNAILKHEPPPLSDVEDLPPPLERMMRHCLEKTPELRPQSAHDLAAGLAVISNASQPPIDTPSRAGASPVATEKLRPPVPRSRPPATPSRVSRWVWLVAAGLLLAALPATIAYFRHTPSDARPIRFFVDPPDGARFLANENGANVSVSSDGRRLVFAAVRDGRSQLWLRPLDLLESQPLHDTDGASSPFWSPDGRFVGFFAEGRLKKVDAFAGSVEIICHLPHPAQGGTWHRDGTILFSTRDGIWKVRESETTARPTGVKGGWPQFLPDGQQFLYLSGPEVRTASLESSETRPMIEAASRPIFVPGHVLHVRDGRLLAQPVGPEGSVTGKAVILAERVHHTGFSASQNGVLVYRDAGPDGPTSPITVVLHWTALLSQ